MVTKIVKNSLLGRVASVAAVIALASASVPVMAMAATTTSALTAEQQSQVTALTAKLLGLAKAQSETTSEGSFTGLFVDALSGYDAQVVAAALAQVAGTPGLNAAAVRAATNLGRAYAANGSTGGTGAVGQGGFGGLPSTGSPGFSSGGGGSNYGQ